MYSSNRPRPFTEFEKAVLIYLAICVEILFPDAPKDKIKHYPSILQRVQDKEKFEGYPNFRDVEGRWHRPVMEDYTEDNQ